MGGGDRDVRARLREVGTAWMEGRLTSRGEPVGEVLGGGEWAKAAVEGPLVEGQVSSIFWCRVAMAAILCWKGTRELCVMAVG